MNEDDYNRLEVSAVTDDERPLTIVTDQSEELPVRSEYPLDDFRQQRTGHGTISYEGEEYFWGAIDGRLYEVELDPATRVASGKFEATLRHVRDAERTMQISGAFRAGITIRCHEKVGETSWEGDPEFESEYCRQFREFESKFD